MMKITGTRFGTIDFDDRRILTLPLGLIGFPHETGFILLEPPAGRIVAWLQSVVSPGLAFPVVTADEIDATYPAPDARELGRRAHISRSDADTFATLVVVAYHPQTGRIANLLAPIVVNLDARLAAQVVLDSDTYSAATPFPDPGAATPAVARRPEVSSEAR
jgi:flagellar assembly factor FliW